jgi:hypothetical protein
MHRVALKQDNPSLEIQQKIGLLIGGSVYDHLGFESVARIEARNATRIQPHVYDAVAIGKALSTIPYNDNELRIFSNFVKCSPKEAGGLYVTMSFPQEHWHTLVDNVVGHSRNGHYIQKMHALGKAYCDPQVAAKLIKTIELPLKLEEPVAPIQKKEQEERVPRGVLLADPLRDRRTWDEDVLYLYRSRLKLPVTAASHEIASALFKSPSMIQEQHLDMLLLGPLETVITWRPTKLEEDATLHECLRDYVIEQREKTGSQ